MSNQINEQVKETLHIYTRVSTCQQVQFLDTQKELGEEKAKELGMTSVVWDEGAVSAKNTLLWSRPVLRKLYVKVDRGYVKHLFVVSIDRLISNDIQLHTIMGALTKNGVVLYTQDGECDCTSYFGGYISMIEMMGLDKQTQKQLYQKHLVRNNV